MNKIKTKQKPGTARAGKDVKQLELSYIAGGDTKGPESLESGLAVSYTV